jgi:hypothetical protein
MCLYIFSLFHNLVVASKLKAEANLRKFPRLKNGRVNLVIFLTKRMHLDGPLPNPQMSRFLSDPCET